MAQAVQRIVAVDGMDGVTVARTAGEAGISVGLVGHYFPSKDQLLLFTFQRVCDGIRERATRALDDGGPAGELVRRCLLEFLPLDPHRTAEMRAYLAFCGRAVDDPRLRRVQIAAYDEVRTFLTELLDEALRAGETDTVADPAAEATALWAFVDGLGLHAYADPDGLPADAVLAALDGYLGRILPKPHHEPPP